MTTREQAEKRVGDLPTLPYVSGRWYDEAGPATVDVVDPVTERCLATVTEADPGTVDRAVAAGRASLDGGEWGRMDGATRGQLLFDLAQRIEDRTEEFADLESLEVGKPGVEPRMIDLPQAIGAFRYYAGWADKLAGHAIPTPGYAGRPTHSYTVREPVGVVAAITPWNSPTMIGAWKITSALAAGCAVVLRPPEDAP